jgi:hypothetical protein
MNWTLKRVSPYCGWTLIKFCIGTIYVRVEVYLFMLNENITQNDKKRLSG